MSLTKTLNFVQKISTIMYVGGILSHIVIGAVLGHPDAGTAYHVSIYKEMSAYVLILPGLALKILSDAIVFFRFEIKPNWLKLKLLMTVFLVINASVFLVPMMPELVELAKESLPSGEVSEKFLRQVHTEQLVGMSNVIPLLLEMILGSFKPAFGRERLNRVFNRE